MQVLVNIPDELAAQLQARGLVLEACLRDLMEEKFSKEQIQDPIRDARRRQAVEAMRVFADKQVATLAGSTSRAWCMKGTNTDAVRS